MMQPVGLRGDVAQSVESLPQLFGIDYRMGLALSGCDILKLLLRTGAPHVCIDDRLHPQRSLPTRQRAATPLMVRS